MRAPRSVRRLSVLAGLLILVAAIFAPASAVAAPTVATVEVRPGETAPSRFTIRPNDVFAGWSVHPDAGTATRANGEWLVPAVQCDAPRLSRPWKQSRAAPWVALWGQSLDPATSWLIQTGTVSQCASGRVFSYKTFWQLFHESKARGYRTPGPSYLFDVQPGDHIGAQVELVSQSDNKMRFELLVADSDASARSGTLVRNDTFIETDSGVQARDAIYQGGCILESEPDGRNLIPLGGLARFTTPFTFISCRVNTSTIDTYSGFASVFRWDMKAGGNGKPLATTNPRGQNGSFSVTWKAWR